MRKYRDWLKNRDRAEYDPVDDVDPSLRRLDFTKISPAFLREMGAVRNYFRVFSDKDIAAFHSGFRSGDPSLLFQLIEKNIVFFDFDKLEFLDELKPRSLGDIREISQTKTEDRHSLSTRAVPRNLAEHALKAMLLGENFVAILRANGYPAFSYKEVMGLKNALIARFGYGNQWINNRRIVPPRAGENMVKAFSPFVSLLSPLDKLLILHAFYVIEFPSATPIQSYVIDLQTVITKNQHYSEVLAQMYYLQPTDVSEDQNEIVITW